MEMVRQSIRMLKLDTAVIIRDITRMVLETIQSSQDSSQLSARPAEKRAGAD